MARVYFALLALVAIVASVHGQRFDKSFIPKHISRQMENLMLKMSATPGGCPIQPIPVPFGPTLPITITTTLAALETYLTNMLSNTSLVLGATGVSASVVYGDNIIWSFGAGTTNSSTPGATPTGNTLYRIGSISKLFPTLETYMALLDGKIASLDDPLSKYFPAFSIINPFTDKSEITFRQVLSQTSGLPREAPCSLITCEDDSAQILALLATERMILPGSKEPSYSNLGFSLLGRLISEQLYDMTWESWVQQNLLDVLGLKNTGTNYTAAVMSQLAVGYNTDGSVAPVYDLGWSAPAGQLYSSTNDLATLLSLWNIAAANNATPILTATTLRESQQIIFLNPDGVTGFGTPWECYFQNNYLLRTKGGSIPGYTAIVASVPELQLGIALLWNGGAATVQSAQLAMNLLIPAFTSALIPYQPAMPVMPVHPANYIGTYQLIGDPSTVGYILNYQGGLLLAFQGSFSVFISYVDDDLFQGYVPPGTLACMAGEELALLDQYIIFNRNSTTVTWSAPGFLPIQEVFIRTSTNVPQAAYEHPMARALMAAVPKKK